jgi:uncharacterized membrane protein
MRKGRLEAFSDGVIAIIITIMVLELKVPEGGGHLTALRPLGGLFLSYVLSFTNVGIYWNNHHHMFQAVQSVDGAVLWANMHLLFWLSLMPFATAWMGENHFAKATVAVYGFDLLMSGLAYFILTKSLLRRHRGDTVFAAAIGGDTKGRIAVVVYLLAIPMAFASRWAALAGYVTVAAMYFVPDRRFERQLSATTPTDD